MKRYELKFDKGETGVFCMSLVENPATKTQLVMFDNETMFFADDEKQIVYSVAMRPNMLIPRKDINGEPALVFYSEDTVKDLQQNFFKTNSHNGATINHNGARDNNLYIFESWVVEDPAKDKATLLGLDVRKGDWVTAQKIDNPDVWSEVKKGNLTGFSIEAYLEPVLTNNKTEMTLEEIDARIKKVLMEVSLGKEYKVGETMYYIDKLEKGGIVTDAEGKPLAGLELEIEGMKLKTDANGVITIEEVEVEQAEDVAPAEDLQAKVDAMQKVIDEKDAEINDLKAKLSEMEAKKTEMTSQLVKMQSDIEQGLKPKGAINKPYSEMSNIEKLKYNRGKL